LVILIHVALRASQAPSGTYKENKQQKWMHKGLDIPSKCVCAVCVCDGSFCVL